MSKIDEFESLFRSSVQERYSPRAYPIREVLVLCDLPSGDDTQLLAQLEPLFEGLSAPPKLTLLPAAQSAALPTLIDLINDHPADLVCAYRNLHTSHGAYPHTLGDHVAVLTQVTRKPILLTPRPEVLGGAPLRAPSRVMTLTDQLSSHPQLIDASAALIKSSGALVLSHVEDGATFSRYMDTISKIPAIDTEEARALIQEQLLRSVRLYAESTVEALRREQPQLEVIIEVKMGHRVRDLVALVEEHRVELVVMNTKDDEQIAMHGLAHPVALELSHLPLLML